MPKPRITRKRVLRGPNFLATTTQITATGSVSADTIEGSAVGSQITDSEGNHWPPPNGVAGDYGGEFRTTKSYVAWPEQFDSFSFATSGYSPEYTFQGNLASANVLSIAYPPTNESKNSRLDQLGATAIARCSPTNSPADVFTFLGELYKDRIPDLVGSELWKAKTGELLKAGSGDYLNAQFGWAPMISDVKKFAKAIVNADKVLAQYERDAGRVVRRQYRFPSTTVTELVGVYPGARPFGVAIGFPPYGTVVVTRETSRKTWFSGAFTYWLPTGYDSRNGMISTARKAEHLLGANFSPDKLWNIAPWSWAVDWFANTGDVLQNLQNFATGGLVMRYGYMMETTTVTDTYTLEGASCLTHPVVLAPVRAVTETKVRRKANPFGFGISWGDLSSFQLSIVAALGLNRGSR